VTNKGLAVQLAGGFVAQAVDAKLSASCHTQPLQDGRSHPNCFHICVRVVSADALHTKLNKLPVPSLLRPFSPEHRTMIIKPLNLMQGQLLPQERPHHAGGPLGSQCYGCTTSIHEGEHLFAYNIRLCSNGTMK
jgi:hypothetical protein